MRPIFMKEKTITTQQAIDLITIGKLVENVTIDGDLILDHEVKDKNIIMHNVHIKGYLNVLTTIGHLYIPNVFVAGFIGLSFARIKGNIDFRGITFDALCAEGAIALAAHISIQSKIITSPSKLSPFSV